MCQPLVDGRRDIFEVGGKRQIGIWYCVVLSSHHGGIALGESKEDLNAIQLAIASSTQSSCLYRTVEKSEDIRSDNMIP